MDFDSYDTLDAQRIYEARKMRWRIGAPRTLVTEAVAAGLVIGAAVALALCAKPDESLNVTSLGMVVALYLVCQKVTFDVGPVYTTAVQLAFVPMLLLLPVPDVPLVVIGCHLLGTVLPGLRPPTLTLARGFASVGGDSAYALGPAVVLALSHQHVFAWSHWPIYCAALAAQIAVDLVCGLTRIWFGEHTSPRASLPSLPWMYVVDIALTTVGLFVVASAQQHHGLVILTLPLVGLLALFARERKQRVESSLALSSTYRETAELLGDVLDDDDAYTGWHSREVAELAVAVGERLELDPLALFNVRYGALLHDVGKIHVPKSILKKPGKLSPEEWKIIREHTVHGQEMLDRVGGGLARVGVIVRHSHEHYDGTGYPDHLAGEEIPLESRIVAAADAWSAMTTSRPYRRALSVELAADEMRRCAGTHFDPEVAWALLMQVAPAYVMGRTKPLAVRT